MLIKRDKKTYIGYYFKMNEDIDDDETIFYINGINENNRYTVTWIVDDDERWCTYHVDQLEQYIRDKVWIII